MKDNQFDLLLKNSLPDLPPEDIANKVNPWRKFVFYIIVGLILSTTRLIGIKYLSFIIPTIGNIFLVQGFQGLRKENRFFYMGWIFSLICFIVMPILRMNPRSFKIGEDSSVLILLVILFAVAFYSQFRCLALGITQIQEKCGVETNDKLKRVILGCSTALVFLNIVSNKPSWISYFTPVVYLLLIWCIILLMREINEIGYAIHIAPIILSNKMIVFLTALLMGSAFLLGEYMISQEPKNQMEWHASNSGDVVQVKNDLIQKGFPEHILDSMLEKDILLCQNAKQLVVKKNERNADNPHIPENYTAYDIAIEMADKDYHWRIIHYFEWTEEENFYNSDCIVLWPMERGHMNAWEIKSGYTGHILYSLDGIDYRASFDDLMISSIYNPDLNSYSGDPEIIAEFTFPKKGQHKRGYISYDAVSINGKANPVNSWMKYVHQTSRFISPVQTAGEYWRNRYFNDGKNEDNFLIIETAIHY